MTITLGSIIFSSHSLSWNQDLFEYVLLTRRYGASLTVQSKIIGRQLWMQNGIKSLITLWYVQEC
jgi:hypothetical protein